MTFTSPNVNPKSFILLTYHGSSKPLACFTELELALDDPLVVSFSFCGKSTSIASSLEVFELVGTVELETSTSISSAILVVSRENNLAPKVELGPKFPAPLCSTDRRSERPDQKYQSKVEPGQPRGMVLIIFHSFSELPFRISKEK